MASGPLQFRRGNKADREAASPLPAAGEPFYDTQAEGLYVGDGSTTGGNEALTSHRRRQLDAAVPIRSRETPGALPLWTCRDWQGQGGDTGGSLTPGWSLPPVSAVTNKGMYAVGHGLLPARAMKHGGYIQIYAYGRYDENSSTVNLCACKLEVNGVYRGPTWETLAQNVGWGLASAESDTFPTGDTDWFLDVRLHSLGWKTSIVNPDGGANNRFLAEGSFSMGGELNGDGLTAAAGARTVKNVYHYFAMDPDRDQELVLYAGSSVYSAAGTSEMECWGSTAVLFHPTPGFEYFA